MSLCLAVGPAVEDVLITADILRRRSTEYAFYADDGLLGVGPVLGMPSMVNVAPGSLD